MYHVHKRLSKRSTFCEVTWTWSGTDGGCDVDGACTHRYVQVHGHWYTIVAQVPSLLLLTFSSLHPPLESCLPPAQPEKKARSVTHHTQQGRMRKQQKWGKGNGGE